MQSPILLSALTLGLSACLVGGECVDATKNHLDSGSGSVQFANSYPMPASDFSMGTTGGWTLVGQDQYGYGGTDKYEYDGLSFDFAFAMRGGPTADLDCNTSAALLTAAATGQPVLLTSVCPAAQVVVGGHTVALNIGEITVSSNLEHDGDTGTVSLLLDIPPTDLETDPSDGAYTIHIEANSLRGTTDFGHTDCPQMPGG